MARRSFSRMLAWRYLNPRRALLSSVAMISVAGVMLGVLVLIVVMSVYNGMEREVKARFLGFVPHIRLNYAPYGGPPSPVQDWRELSEQVGRFPGVVEAGPFVQDSMLVDIGGFRSPGIFRAVNTENPRDVQGIRNMLDMEAHPESSAEMGLDDKIVISSRVAKSFSTGVGGKAQLLTLRNLEEVERVYELAERPLVREEFAAQLSEIRQIAKAEWKVKGDTSEIPTAAFNKILDQLSSILNGNVRDAEYDIALEAILFFEEANRGADNLVQVHTKDAPEKFLSILSGLDSTDKDKLNAQTLLGIRELVLPKESEIIGVYQTTQMAMTPDVFMPLHLSQELTGIGDSVQGISVRLEDPYQAAVVAEQLMAKLPPGWYPVTWFQEMQEFSTLIHQQRVMLSFALSFIILISAFSMTAVMFTVTIQKRREIGVMKALGAAPGQIVWVFVNQGIILGVLGMVIGVILAMLVIRFREAIQAGLRQFGFDPFPAELIGFPGIPAHVNPVEVLIVSLGAWALCAGAAFLPAFFAARSDAAKSLRNL